MENLTLSLTTRIALQNFLQIWKQDPLAQQTLCIAPQNIFICDPQRPDQITDITIEVEEPNDIEQENSFSIEEFIDIEPTFYFIGISSYLIHLFTKARNSFCTKLLAFLIKE